MRSPARTGRRVQPRAMDADVLPETPDSRIDPGNRERSSQPDDAAFPSRRRPGGRRGPVRGTSTKAGPVSRRLPAENTGSGREISCQFRSEVLARFCVRGTCGYTSREVIALHAASCNDCLPPDGRARPWRGASSGWVYKKLDRVRNLLCRKRVNENPAFSAFDNGTKYWKVRGNHRNSRAHVFE